MGETTKTVWMRNVLIAAALYNLVWGVWVVLFPESGFRLAGLPLPPYPEIWQCLGMIVGAYGIGYAIAATDPFRHWPIVFVGLLGKVLAAIVFVHGVRVGHLPLRAGWTILTNDLIWWAPFGMILYRVYAEHKARERCCSPEVVSLALRARTNTGATLEQMSRESPVMVVFLRHAGCTFCREALADLGKQRRDIGATGTSIVLVHMSDEEYGRQFFRKYGLEGLPHISDPSADLYRAFGLRRGSLRMLFGPKVWWRGFEAGVRDRHGVGRLRGDGFQMPGVFLVFHGHIIRSFRHQSAADRPDYVRFVSDEEEVPVRVSRF
jgi:peroxiredoxin